MPPAARASGSPRGRRRDRLNLGMHAALLLPRRSQRKSTLWDGTSAAGQMGPPPSDLPGTAAASGRHVWIGLPLEVDMKRQVLLAGLLVVAGRSAGAQGQPAAQAGDSVPMEIVFVVFPDTSAAD